VSARTSEAAPGTRSALHRLARAWRGLPRRRELLRARLHRLLARDARPRKQIVICGFPRSGTSLLYNMLAVALPDFSHDAFEESALRSLWRYEDHLSKLPLDVMRLAELARHNVHRKQIYVLVPVRDPRDLVTSIHPNVPDDYFIGWEASYRVGLGDAGGPTLSMPGIRDILAALDAVVADRGFTRIHLRYEDLVRDPDGVERLLASQLGVSFRARLADFHQHAERLPYRYDAAHTRPATDLSLAREAAPIDASRAGKWREPAHRARIASEFGRYPELLELVRNWGYERDDAWFAAYRSVS
jgi:hypothetical protein